MATQSKQPICYLGISGIDLAEILGCMGGSRIRGRAGEVVEAWTDREGDVACIQEIR